MDIYVLDSNFEKIDIVDEYLSMIWTERYSDTGDFQLSTLTDLKWKTLLREGRYLSIPGSNRVQLIESVEETTKDELRTLNVSGRTPECWLEDRVIMQEGVYYVGSPISFIVMDIVKSAFGFQQADDPNRNDGITFGGIPNSDATDYDRPVSDAFSAAKGLADIGNLGFKMVPDGSNLQFSLYVGTVRENLIFSTQTETLEDTSYLRSTKGYKNIARVKYKAADGKANWTYIAAPGFDNSVTGFARKVLNVDATDIDHPTVQNNYLTNMVRTKALIELAKHQKINLYTGTVHPSSSQRYNVDYGLGDIGTVLSDDGSLRQQVRVTEYIFASDTQEGDRDYPTFALVE